MEKVENLEEKDKPTEKPVEPLEDVRNRC